MIQIHSVVIYCKWNRYLVEGMTKPISSFHFVGMFFLLLGHCVVVCGYDLKKKKIFYKNPSYDEGKHYTYVKTIKFFLSPPPKFQSTVDCYPKDVIHSSYIMCKLKYMLYRCISKHIKTYLSSLAVMELYGSWNLIKLNFWTTNLRVNQHSSDMIDEI